MTRRRRQIFCRCAKNPWASLVGRRCDGRSLNLDVENVLEASGRTSTKPVEDENFNFENPKKYLFFDTFSIS